MSESSETGQDSVTWFPKPDDHVVRRFSDVLASRPPVRRPVESSASLFTAVEIVERLAEFDPYRAAAIHGSGCYFCGHQGYVEHHADCLWLEAGRLVKP